MDEKRLRKQAHLTSGSLDDRAFALPLRVEVHVRALFFLVFGSDIQNLI
jgi:hypothetical protein